MFLYTQSQISRRFWIKPSSKLIGNGLEVSVSLPWQGVFVPSGVIVTKSLTGSFPITNLEVNS